jgi:hypothetical protein
MSPIPTRSDSVALKGCGRHRDRAGEEAILHDEQVLEPELLGSNRKRGQGLRERVRGEDDSEALISQGSADGALGLVVACHGIVRPPNLVGAETLST